MNYEGRAGQGTPWARNVEGKIAGQFEKNDKGEEIKNRAGKAKT